VYEGGVLKPDERLDMPEGSRGVARIVSNGASGSSAAQRARALAAIRRIGESGAFNSGGRKLSRDDAVNRFR
jgi:predicted DNA-binding antitoxin AbrB/MazE fold protein